MARAAIILVLVAVLASPSVAGVGRLGVYADADGNLCNLTDPGGGALVMTYVVHNISLGEQATGSRFAIQGPTNGTWLLVEFDSAFSTVGSALTDISVSYGPCVTVNTHIGTALWISTVAPACGFVSLTAANAQPDIIISDCTFTDQPSSPGQQLYVNPTPSCDCLAATEPSTWGSVKALYR